MSRVHDALRRAEQMPAIAHEAPPSAKPELPEVHAAAAVATVDRAVEQQPAIDTHVRLIGRELLNRVQEVPFRASPEAHLIDS